MKKLSIVFQGPILNTEGMIIVDVILHLKLTRQNFPNSEIIISTWAMSYPIEVKLREELQSLAVILIMSKDPGPLSIEDHSGKYVCNLNRMLISSSAGLKACTRELAVKIRTDCWLSDRKLEYLLNRHVLADSPYHSRNPNYSVFRARVINYEIFARDARGSLPYLYHPSDLFLAGFTCDLQLFFSAPLANLSLFRPSSMAGLWCAWRFVPEQWCWVHAIRKTKGIWAYDGNFDYTEANITASEQWYLSNFIPYSSKDLSLHWKKYWRYYYLRGMFSVYTHVRWKRLAARYDGGQTNSYGDIFSLLDYFLTTLWRFGYRMRAILLRNSTIRFLAIKFFVHRK